MFTPNGQNQKFHIFLKFEDTICQLINELQSFENQDLEVRISLDGGVTSKCISLVSKSNGVALLENCEDDSDASVAQVSEGGEA